MMTALTFIVGSLPLAFSTGAGAVSRQEIGTVVVGGMLVASTLALFFVPNLVVLPLVLPLVGAAHRRHGARRSGISRREMARLDHGARAHPLLEDAPARTRHPLQRRSRR